MGDEKELVCQASLEETGGREVLDTACSLIDAESQAERKVGERSRSTQGC